MRKPDVVIGERDKPYLLRWWLTKRLTERSKWYLHHILRDDEDRALHDHPSDNLSVILWNGYIEHLPNGKKKYRFPGMIVFRRAEQAHRLELFKDKNGNPKPAWTLFRMGPKKREWGFYCLRGWVHWKIFCSDKDTNEVEYGLAGRGCD